jgi:hypothetical protein
MKSDTTGVVRSGRGRYPDAETRELDAALLEWIHTAPAGFVRAATSPQECYGLAPAAHAELERRFEALALRLFAYQCEHVPEYAAWARACGRTPATVRRAIDVPALPVEAFRHARIAGFPPDAEVASFHTSGTTGGAPGVLGLDTLALYDAALERGFAHHVTPDTDRIRMLLLAPPWEETPHSSLGYMLDRVRRLWGTGTSAHCVHAGVLQWRLLRAELENAAAVAEPVCLLGTTFAYVQLLDAAAAEGWEVQLPAGSRLFETGGTKGRSRELSRQELHRALGERLGLPEAFIVCEYGMTELGSQYYTLSLRHALVGEGPPPDAAAGRRPPTVVRPAERWSAPIWLRPRILDSSTGEPRELVSGGEIGLLAHHDLANRGSVAHLLCADLGEPSGASFVLRGRCPRAELRGCGLVYENTATTAPGPRTGGPA